MAKARRVPGIQAKESLRDNARRVIDVRLDELLSWRAALEDPDLVTQLHNMRIAAKRLRYALEIFEICFLEAKGSVKRLSLMQDHLGSIHDLDVLIEILRAHLRDLDLKLEAQGVETIRAVGSSRERSNKLRQLLYAQAREPRRLGLIGLIADKTLERERYYMELVEKWGPKTLDALAEELRQATGLVQAPFEAQSASPDLV